LLEVRWELPPQLLESLPRRQEWLPRRLASLPTLAA
jgi:hypothetical protein